MSSGAGGHDPWNLKLVSPFLVAAAIARPSPRASKVSYPCTFASQLVLRWEPETRSLTARCPTLHVMRTVASSPFNANLDPTYNSQQNIPPFIPLPTTLLFHLALL